MNNYEKNYFTSECYFIFNFHFQLLGDGEEAVELLLSHVHLTLVHEVQHGHQLLVLNPLQVEEGVLVRVAPQDVSTRACAFRKCHRLTIMYPVRQCCGSGSAWIRNFWLVPDPELYFRIRIQQKVKEHINKSVNSGLFVLLDSSIE